MIRVSEGKYRIGDTKVLIFVRILRSHVMVRVGGGWDTLSHYLDKHDPCRCRTCKWIFQYFAQNLFSLFIYFFFSRIFLFFSDVANRETYKKIWDIGDSLNKDELIVVENKDDDRRFYYEFVKDGPFFPYFFFFLWSEIYELSDLYLF